MLTAHHELALAYAGVLESADRLKAIRVAPSSPEQVAAYRARGDAYQRQYGPLNIRFMNFFSVGYLVRLFVASHVKSRLNQLTLSYRNVLITIPPAWLTDESEQTSERVASALDKTQASSQLLTDRLSSGHAPVAVLRAVVPVVSAVFVAIVGGKTVLDAVEHLGLASKDVILIAAIALIPAMYLSLVVSNSYLYKRELFLPGAWFLERGKKIVMDPPPLGRNLYELETKLFDQLGMRKIPEMYADVFASIAGGVVTVAVAVFVTAVWVGGEQLGNLSFLFIATAYLALLYLLITFSDFLIPLRRSWR